MTAEAADPLQYREALIAGDPARLSAMIEADKRQLPIDDAVITVLRRALHVYRWVSVHGSAGTRWKQRSSPVADATGCGEAALAIDLRAGSPGLGKSAAGAMAGLVCRLMAPGPFGGAHDILHGTGHAQPGDTGFRDIWRLPQSSPSAYCGRIAILPDPGSRCRSLHL